MSAIIWGAYGVLVMDATEKWTTPLRNWELILNQLHVFFGERLDAYLCPCGLCELVISAKIVTLLTEMQRIYTR